MEKAVGKSWIQCFSGGRFFPLAPLAKDVRDLDVGHALSNLCRFTGHVRDYYSVAQHCVHVAELLEEVAPGDPELHLAGLVHDASEAYLADIASPVKRSGEFGRYRAAEHVLEGEIEKHYGLILSETQRALIHWADAKMLHTEARDLMSPLQVGWGLETLPPARERLITPWAPREAKRAWLSKLMDLQSKRATCPVREEQHTGKDGNQ